MTVDLNREQIAKRQHLTEKLIGESILKEEAEELKSILEIEREKAVELNDCMSMIAILFLLNRVNDFLSTSNHISIEGITLDDFPNGIDFRQAKGIDAIIKKKLK